MQSESDKQDYGRRLYAAVLSCHLHAKSIDETLAFEVPASVDPFWVELANTLVSSLNRKLARKNPAGSTSTARLAG